MEERFIDVHERYGKVTELTGKLNHIFEKILSDIVQISARILRSQGKDEKQLFKKRKAGDIAKSFKATIESYEPRDASTEGEIAKIYDFLQYQLIADRNRLVHVARRMELEHFAGLETPAEAIRVVSTERTKRGVVSRRQSLPEAISELEDAISRANYFQDQLYKIDGQIVNCKKLKFEDYSERD